MDNFPGLLIAFEGIDGAGKSTHAQALAQRLEKRGEKVILRSEPTHGPEGAVIREILSGTRPRPEPKEEAELFLQDRARHVREVLGPALASGTVVILDRYFYSTAAYQGARGLDPAEILAANRRIAPEPNLVFLFSVPVEEAMRRIAGSRKSLSSFEFAPYLQEVAGRFERFHGPNITVINGYTTPEDIEKQLLAGLSPVLSRWRAARDASGAAAPAAS
jgi:dTMP kinase